MMLPVVVKGHGEGYRLAFDRLGHNPEFEVPVQHCMHCKSVVVMNPQRKRPRGHCRKCDHYVCDDITCNLKCPHERA